MLTAVVIRCDHFIGCILCCFVSLLVDGPALNGVINQHPTAATTDFALTFVFSMLFLFACNSIMTGHAKQYTCNTHVAMFLKMAL